MKKRSERDTPIPIIRSTFANGIKSGKCKIIIEISTSTGDEILNNDCNEIHLSLLEMTKQQQHCYVKRSCIKAKNP